MRRRNTPAPIEQCPPVRDEPPVTDLRGITRYSDRCVTRVAIRIDWSKTVEWLICGQSDLTRASDTRQDGRWRLTARMGDGTTDFEHDSAYAFQLALIGLQLDSLAVNCHISNFVAWVDPNDPDGFRVPRPGYDPSKHPESHRCKDRQCAANGNKDHIILPEGFFVPPFDAELYKLVRGKQVSISIGPVFGEG